MSGLHFKDIFTVVLCTWLDVGKALSQKYDMFSVFSAYIGTCSSDMFTETPTQHPNHSECFWALRQALLRVCPLKVRES